MGELVPVGYSFADQHINKIIFEAAERGLKIFIVDPTRAMLITKIPNYNPPPKIKAAIAGASSRPYVGETALPSRSRMA
jgi:hypothetical protein